MKDSFKKFMTHLLEYSENRCRLFPDSGTFSSAPDFKSSTAVPTRASNPSNSFTGFAIILTPITPNLTERLTSAVPLLLTFPSPPSLESGLS